MDLALGWQQGAVSPCVAKIQILSGIPFSPGKSPWFCQLPAGQDGAGKPWGNWRMEDFSKRAVGEPVLRKTEQLSQCGWKILLGTWGDGHHHPAAGCV